MSVTFPPDATFATLPMLHFRNLLAGWLKGRAVATVADTRKVGLDPSTAAAAMDEAFVQGLLADPADPMFLERDTPRSHLLASWDRRRGGPRVTVRGVALATSTPSAPLSREKALAVLGTLLDNASSLNTSPDMPFVVERIWSYGSLAKGADAVNDVDVVVETSRTEHWDMDGRSESGRRWIDMASAMGGRAALTGLGSVAGRALDYLERRLVQGPRRHPRLSFNDLETLRSLACECRLVFDRARGGPVDDPLLERHPGSGGRADWIFERLVMPDLSPVTSLRPVDARFVDAGHLHRMGEDDRPIHSRGGRGWSGDVEVGRTSHLGTGVATTGFVVGDPQGSAAWTVTRTMRVDLGDDAYDYALEVGSVTGASDARLTGTALSFVSDLVRADVERIAMHSLGTRGPMHLWVSTSASAGVPDGAAIARSLHAAILGNGGFPGPLGDEVLLLLDGNQPLDEDDEGLDLHDVPRP